MLLVVAAYFVGRAGGIVATYNYVVDLVGNIKGDNTSDIEYVNEYTSLAIDSETVSEIEKDIKEEYYKDIDVTFSNVKNTSGIYEVQAKYINEENKTCYDKINLYVFQSTSSLKLTMTSHSAYSNTFSQTYSLMNNSTSTINGIKAMSLSVSDSNGNLLCGALFLNIDFDILPNSSIKYTFCFDNTVLTDYYKQNYKQYTGYCDLYYSLGEIL